MSHERQVLKVRANQEINRAALSADHSQAIEESHIGERVSEVGRRNLPKRPTDLTG